MTKGLCYEFRGYNMPKVWNLAINLPTFFFYKVHSMVSSAMSTYLWASLWVPTDVSFVTLFLSSLLFVNKIVTYQEFFCVVTQLASASNHENDDGNSRNISCSQFCEFSINKGIEDNIFSNLIELTKMIYQHFSCDVYQQIQRLWEEKLRNICKKPVQ